MQKKGLQLNSKIIAILPIAIAVNLACVLIWLLQITDQSMPLILGVIAASLVDLDHRLSGRLKNIFYTLIAFSISSLVTQYFLNQGIWFVLSMTAMTFVFTMIGAVGQRYSTIAFGTLVVSLYTTLAYIPDTPWYINPLMILAGTLLYSVITVTVHLCFPNRPLQEKVSRAFVALGAYLDAKAAFFDPDDIEQLASKQLTLAMKNSQIIQVFNECRTALFYRMRDNHRYSYTSKMCRYYMAAQEIHERANSSHFDYKTLAEQLKNADLIFRIQRLLELQAQACRDIAHALQKAQDYQPQARLERAIQGISQSFELYAQQHQDNSALHHIKTLLDNLHNIHCQLQSLSQPIQTPETRTIYTENITGLRQIVRHIGRHFTFQSQLFRHAMRLSLVVFFCCALVEYFHLQADRGYWILLTIIFVCQPNYSATKLRLKQRIIGTILGVIVGSLLPYMTSTLEAKLAVVVIASTLFYFFRSNNYSFSTFFITIQVLASFDIMGFDLYAALLPRLIDTLIGTALAWFAVSYLWSDWKYLQLDQVSQQVIKSQANYLLHIISHLQFGRGDDLKYRIVRREAHDNATRLSTTISNMNNEPKKYARHLQQGFELLKLNTALLGYISALGAYREQMQKLTQDVLFLSEFYPIAKKIIQLLDSLPSLSAVQFEALFQQIDQGIKNSLAQTNDTPSRAVFNMPMQQLNLMAQLLPPLYHLVQTPTNQDRPNEIRAV
ncbi:YccS family putative transporter [Lonepinella sp. BR2357]|uniref:YccS family putative transporter n=1 Tax=Lonepinella sp. BR2357 TaxID=3434549 RepID=UPI003F6E4015